MLGRLILGIVVVAAMLVVLSYTQPSTRERILEVAGPVDPDAPPEFSVTDSGLRYRVLRQGDGRNPQPSDTVMVNYAGWLDDGTQFDKSYGSAPFATPLSRVIPGWTEGLQLVDQGGMIELEVPSELAYGAQGDGSRIPPHATLHFIIELLDVASPPVPAEAGPRDPDAPEEYTTTESGLKYRVLRKGEGDGKHPSIDDTVTIHYQGWFDDGNVFDSSYHRGTRETLPLREVIAGWSEGLAHIGEGGMIEMEVPSELGYGAEGMGPVPPNATLHYLVELFEVH